MKKNGDSQIATDCFNGIPDVSRLSHHYGVPTHGMNATTFGTTTFGGTPVLERPWKANIQPTLNQDGHLNTTGVRMTPLSGERSELFGQEPDYPPDPLDSIQEEDSSKELIDQTLALVERLIACGVDPNVAADAAVALLTSGER